MQKPELTIAELRKIKDFRRNWILHQSPFEENLSMIYFIRKDGKAVFRLYHYYVTLNETLFIDHLSIDKDFWNKGIGSGILETAKKVAAHMNKGLMLYTKPHLIGWYEKRGFVVTDDETEDIPDHVWMEYKNEES